MKQKPFRVVHLCFLVTLLGTPGLLNEHLHAADDVEQFKTQKIAPDIIIPAKIGQHHYSRHSVISDAFRMLESEQEEQARENVEAQLNAAQEKLKRSEKALNEAEERLQGAPAEGSQITETTRARDDAKTARDDAQNEVKEAEDVKRKIDQLNKIPLQQLSLILNKAKVEKLAFRQDGPSSSDTKDTVVVGRKGEQLDFWLPMAMYHGYVTVQLSLADRFSQPYEIVVAKVNRWQVTGLASAVAAVILGLPILMIGRIKSSYTINAHPCSVWTMLFLDQETDTYSLSKFQFLVWTAVSLFGYSFLTLAKSLMQDTVVFSDLPENLPGIIAISAGTGVLAPAITAIKGPKGAGQLNPSPADFITTGGLVVAERFQFFVWTILGALTFLFLIISSDPSGIQGLPSIPAGFLQLMGISSFGYLAGKIARKPGPIINDLSPAVDATGLKSTSLRLVLTGRKLSKTASFKIDAIETELGKHQFEVRVNATDADEQSTNPGFYRVLTLAIDKPEASWLIPGSHTLMIINPDGQSADCPFELVPISGKAGILVPDK